MLSFIIVVFLFLTMGCTTAFLPGTGCYTEQANILKIGKLIFHAYESARKEISKKDTSQIPLQKYMETLIADGRVTVGLGIGTQDLGKVFVPERVDDRISRAEYMICGKKVLVEARLILTRDEFQKALSECEIIFVTSHSRFGAGPVFLNDGKAKPFKMQQTENYEIIMP